MGYTHYYTVRGWDKPKWQAALLQLVQDVSRIIDASDVPITGPSEDYDEITPVILDEEAGIWLNGAAEDGFEPLVIDRSSEGGSFCKTSRRPYDVVVACTLLRAAMLAGSGFKLSSDGFWDEDWLEARELYRRLWPEEPPRRPWTLE